MTETNDTTDYRGPKIPDDVGEALATALGLTGRPETLGEWASAMADVVEREDISMRPEALCTTSHSPHKAEFDNETQHYRCVQDTFLVPYLSEGVDTVYITTESPVSGDRIEITASDDGIDVDPSGAVMSIGVADDVTETAADTGSQTLAYDTICPYGHAFSDREEYEEWADSVAAATMVAPLDDALHFARALTNSAR